MKVVYPVIIKKNTDDMYYSARVPDLPGCYSAGDELEQTLENVRGAILLRLRTLDEIPKPSNHLKIDKDGGDIVLVDIEL